MKRRNFIKVAGVSAISLMGLERLAQAMAASEPLAIARPVECPEFEGSFSCTGSVPYECENFQCGNGIQQTFRCNPTDRGESFRCIVSFHGCNTPGDFYCEGVDPDVSQFRCSGEFAGCYGQGGFFRCDDFTCETNYRCSSDASNTCQPRYPYYCATPHTA